METRELNTIMILNLETSNLIERRFLLKKRLILLNVLISSFFLFYLALLDITHQPKTSFQFSYVDLRTRYDTTYLTNEFLGIWILSLLFISLVVLPTGVLTNYIPSQLDEIINSNLFNSKVKNDLEKDSNNSKIIFDLNDISLEVIWDKRQGLPHHWKIKLTLSTNIKDLKNRLDQLSMLLLLEKGENRINSYQKTILIREWPRQEYLIYHWLNQLKSYP